MAADVDKTSPENGNDTPPQTGNATSGVTSGICKGLWTLILVAVVPIFAFGIKYYQDTHLLKRHVRHTSVMRFCSLIQYLLSILTKTLAKNYVLGFFCCCFIYLF